jgi:hypothetical protein
MNWKRRAGATCGPHTQVIGTLTAAYVKGQPDKDELDLRVGRAFASRTYADLATLTADLPASWRKPSRASPPGRKADSQSRGPAGRSRRPPRRMQAYGRTYCSCLQTVAITPRFLH